VSETIPTFDVALILRDFLRPDCEKRFAAAAKSAEGFRILASFGSGGLVVGGFTGETPWEVHPATDELLYAVQGEAEITILTDDGTRHGILRQGHACVVPKGLWHRQVARSGIKFLAVSGPAVHSSADDPRGEPVTLG
jgi:mannose-6-phosphate isomerase-like protein (cupin superfamily)